MSTTPITYYRGTIEYISVRVACDVDLEDQAVEFSFDRDTWYPAEAVGDPGPSREYRLLVGDDIAWPERNSPAVYVQITDNPEIPIKRAGSLALI